ncbi:MAG: HEAT repeat domain-containing protein [Cyanobacteria bacterium P01_A01_bin.15]
MIWRSTLVFLTSLTVLAPSVQTLRAESTSLLVAQSSIVDPNAAVNTGEAVPTVGGTNGGASSPLEGATSEQQVEEIKTLQQELKNRGYYDGPIDGIYGPITAEAIQTLRGQQGELPRLFAPDTPSTELATQPPVAEQPAAQPEPTEATAADSTIGGSSATAVPDEITLDEEGGGTDASAAEAAPPSSEAEAEAPPAETTTTSSPGLGALLWPGLAIIAAIGSFGIGFILANRVQAQANDDAESPWGDVPNEVPQPELDPQSPASHNGQVTANGATSEREADIVIEPSPLGERLSIIPAHNGEATRLAKTDVIDELTSNLQVSDPTKRRKAIWELGQRGNSSAVNHLVTAMVDADSKEKSLILAALSEIGIRSLKPMNRALAIALQDDNPDVRKNAIRDLTRVYDLVTQISQMLGHATEDEDAEVRRTAEWALAQLNRIREAPKLKSSLNTLESSRAPSELLPDEVENLKN